MKDITPVHTGEIASLYWYSPRLPYCVCIEAEGIHVAARHVIFHFSIHSRVGISSLDSRDHSASRRVLPDWYERLKHHPLWAVVIDVLNGHLNCSSTWYIVNGNCCEIPVSGSPIQIWPSRCFYVPRAARNVKAARGSDLNRTELAEFIGPKSWGLFH